MNSDQVSNLSQVLNNKANELGNIYQLRDKVNFIVDEANKLRQYSIDITDEIVTGWVNDLNSAIEEIKNNASGIDLFEVSDQVDKLQNFIRIESVLITKQVEVTLQEEVTETVEATTRMETDVEGNQVEVIDQPAGERVVTPARTEMQTVADLDNVGRILGADVGDYTAGTTLTEELLNELVGAGTTELELQVILSDDQ